MCAHQVGCQEEENDQSVGLGWQKGQEKGDPYMGAKQGPGEGGSLGGSSLNIRLELGSGDTKVSKLDTCLLLWGMTLPGTDDAVCQALT